MPHRLSLISETDVKETFVGLLDTRDENCVGHANNDLNANFSI